MQNITMHQMAMAQQYSKVHHAVLIDKNLNLLFPTDTMLNTTIIIIIIIIMFV